MKANELRINNWVHNEITGRDMQVYPMMIPQMEHTKPKHDNGIVPILLTEEWLKKFGFRKVYSWFDIKISIGNVLNVRFFEDKHISVWLSERKIPKFCESRLNWLNGKREIIMIEYDLKYVHQLQNLYFALTGEELIIKE
jgi:hypothetical protein